MSADVRDLAADWLAQDPDPETRAELVGLLSASDSGDASAQAELEDRFGARLAFGTAGLRGSIAAGSNRMNRVLVSQAAVGLADHLLAQGLSRPVVVIGFDGRKNSRIFAEDSAALMAGAGVDAVLLPRLLPTPVLAFAVRHLGADAGVMVTASHNPPQDNGYKVYLGGADEGSQIVPPADSEIAERILAVARDRRVPELPRGDYRLADESVVTAYVEATAAVGRQSAPLRVVYTAMHGVGWETAHRVLSAAGFDEPAVVVEQIEPDAAFPTVTFPNPEEAGALDLAFATARSGRAELIVANDPDADRFAAAVPDASTPEGFRRLTGNEVGALLGWRAAEQARREGRSGGALACSIVSSPALGAVATDYGLDFAETLTGFKWISRVPDLVFGYEEALGYLVNPGTVRDKDGVSAALAFLSLASALAAEERTVDDELAAFAERFGLFGSEQISLRVTDLSEIGRIMAGLRATPPIAIGGLAVERSEDLLAEGGALPPTDALRFSLDGARLIARPSGTEPKVKLYLDAWSHEPAATARRSAVSSRLAALRAGAAALLA
ncbi:phospho-sugar mutase [Rathayibacter rathayi]|uniref:Phospho-sugar mutase n=1 Tax=Rathayibacter rathayi TaxID=33887 RepID=A0ABD6W9Y0_RATRA|nr:phospho-sugar mutase [Rathayibacter rathayi]AZZ49368.1 phospho-sugar mutase [Rathayibacter rathayi]MWV73467.1 phospho-sugar mutase [Rathayibacter rathayi NCPPB 2980 = VKM Ac-1601]PPF14983.1 phospho-sugar mutase [Rathayibacter rathayi]PPF50276.1 phospho-sugar mutase [Rathayibacter rathayi]PPF81220.1 phospho-sugar mutase [Rathayibacter rathayi]